jgi:hypothetical protein
MKDFSPEMKKLMSERVDKAVRLQGDLSRKLDEIERQIKVMRQDIAAGCNPRYHGSLLANALQANETAIRITALCE